MADLQKIADSVINGKAADVKNLVNAAVSEKVPVGDILKKGLIIQTWWDISRDCCHPFRERK